MIKSGVALAALLCAAAPTVSHGQVFLASRPHPEFNWRPIVISAIILLVTNFAGVLMLSSDVSRRIRRRRRARRRFGAAAATPNGTLPTRETLAALIPAGTTYADVVARFGRPDEEHERVLPPGRRTLTYRGTADGAEYHEVAIELHDDRVREVTCVTSR